MIITSTKQLQQLMEKRWTKSVTLELGSLEDRYTIEWSELTDSDKKKPYTLYISLQTDGFDYEIIDWDERCYGTILFEQLPDNFTQIKATHVRLIRGDADNSNVKHLQWMNDDSYYNAFIYFTDEQTLFYVSEDGWIEELAADHQHFMLMDLLQIETMIFLSEIQLVQLLRDLRFNPVVLAHFKACLPQILAVTHQAGHTVDMVQEKNNLLHLLQQPRSFELCLEFHYPLSYNILMQLTNVLTSGHCQPHLTLNFLKFNYLPLLENKKTSTECLECLLHSELRPTSLSLVFTSKKISLMLIKTLIHCLQSTSSLRQPLELEINNIESKIAPTVMDELIATLIANPLRHHLSMNLNMGSYRQQRELRLLLSPQVVTTLQLVEVVGLKLQEYYDTMTASKRPFFSATAKTRKKLYELIVQINHFPTKVLELIEQYRQCYLPSDDKAMEKYFENIVKLCKLCSTQAINPCTIEMVTNP